MIYGKEGLAFALMAPGVIAGLWYVAAGPRGLWLAIALATASVAVALDVAVHTTFGSWRRGGPAIAGGRAGGFAAVPGGAGVHGVVGGLLPLRAGTFWSRGWMSPSPPCRWWSGMGVVEWRALRFDERARALMARVPTTREFIVRVWLRSCVTLAPAGGRVGSSWSAARHSGSSNVLSPAGP